MLPSEALHCLALLHCTTSKRVVGSAVHQCSVPRPHSAVTALHSAIGQCSGMSRVWGQHFWTVLGDKNRASAKFFRVSLNRNSYIRPDFAAEKGLKGA